MPTVLPPRPSATLAPSGALTPSSSTTYTDAPLGTLPLTGSATETYGHPVVYTDHPIGHIGGTLVLGGGGIVKVGGSSVNQEPQRRYPQQLPPKIVHVEYQTGRDAQSGTLRLSGAATSTHERPVFRVTAGRYHGEPTIQDVLAAQRRARRIIRTKVGT